MILGFKQQFKPKILADTKKHTIREDKHNRWKAGNIIHFAIGVRTKFYECFKIGKCVSTQKIEIFHSIGYVEVKIEGKYFGHIYHHDIDDIYEYTNDVELLAKNDGFDSLNEFCNWFNKDFKGKIIHWTGLRY